MLTSVWGRRVRIILVGETSSLLTIVNGVKWGGSKILVLDFASGPAIRYKAVARPEIMASAGIIRLLVFDFCFGCSVATKESRFWS